MILPYNIFEKLIREYINQRKAEEELCEGFHKYNGTYGPILELPLTCSLPDIIDELYGGSNLTWWLFDLGEIDTEKLINTKAVIIYTDTGKKRKVKTLKDLWEYMEEEACQKS